MKTVTVFGSSGRTGLEILKIALDKGFEVRAFCRDRKRVSISNDRLEVIEGDILNPGDVYPAVRDSQYVISSIGTLPPYKDLFCYDAMKNIIYAMYEFRIRRIVCITGAMIGDFTPNQSWFMKFIAGRFNKSKPLAALDRLKQEMAVKASKLDWTLIKPPKLTSGPLTEYSAAEDLKITAFSSISRVTLASYIIDILDNPTTYEKALFVKK